MNQNISPLVDSLQLARPGLATKIQGLLRLAFLLSAICTIAQVSFPWALATVGSSVLLGLWKRHYRAQISIDYRYKTIELVDTLGSFNFSRRRPLEQVLGIRQTAPGVASLELLFAKGKTWGVGVEGWELEQALRLGRDLSQSLNLPFSSYVAPMAAPVIQPELALCRN